MAPPITKGMLFSRPVFFRFTQKRIAPPIGVMNSVNMAMKILEYNAGLCSLDADIS